MKKNIVPISPRYIIDNRGKKKEVVLDIKVYDKLIEELEDYYLAIEAEKILKSGEFVDFEEANKKILKK
jgi:predicted DNA-binding protein